MALSFNNIQLHIQRVDGLVKDAEARGVISELTNGVGSEKPILKYFKPASWIRELFAEEAKFHDVGYWVGGSYEHQEVIDDEFSVRCFKKVQKLPWLKRVRATFWLRADEDVLKNFGAFSFEARKEPCYSLDMLLAEAAMR